MLIEPVQLKTNSRYYTCRDTSPHIPSTSPEAAGETLTWGRGQQAHSPVSFLQQVVPPGHIVCLSHFSSCTSEVRAETFSTQRRGGRNPDGSSQVSASRLQTVSWGQQWTWSSQHTAWQEHTMLTVFTLSWSFAAQNFALLNTQIST